MTFHKAIIIFMLWAGVAFGQSTSGWQTVVTDGTGDLYTNGATLTSELEIIKPAYFCLSSGTDPEIVADSVNLVGGGLVSGTVTNTRVIDSSYYIVNETSRPDIRFTFTNVTAEPIEVLWEGYYDGNPSHSWTLYLWNFTSNQWDTLATDVLPDTSGDDYSVIVPIPEPQTNYNVGGVVTSRWYHSSSIVAANTIGFDYTAILQAQVNIETAGMFTVVGDVANCVTPKRFNINTTTGAATNTIAGTYSFSIGGSGTGTTNTIFRGSIFTNGVATDIGFYRRINAAGDVGNAWGHGILEMGVGVVVDGRITSDKDHSHASFFNFKFGCNRIDD